MYNELFVDWYKLLSRNMRRRTEKTPRKLTRNTRLKFRASEITSTIATPVHQKNFVSRILNYHRCQLLLHFLVSFFPEQYFN
jgi:hypothetical protein